VTRPSSSPPSPYPVTFDLDRPSKMSRAHVFLRIVILILASWIIGTWGWMGLLYLGLPATAAVLIAHKNGTRYLTENGDRVTGWVAFIVGALAYLALLTDELPGAGRQPVRLAVARSGSPTVGSALLRILKAIPSAIALALLGLASSIVWLIAAVSILLTEQYPTKLWNSQYAVLGWLARLLAYLASLVEQHPPFTLDTPTATPHTA
jgi:hypothetical protein